MLYLWLAKILSFSQINNLHGIHKRHICYEHCPCFASGSGY
jgi:hypothetical protein